MPRVGYKDMQPWQTRIPSDPRLLQTPNLAAELAGAAQSGLASAQKAYLEQEVDTPIYSYDPIKDALDEIGSYKTKRGSYTKPTIETVKTAPAGSLTFEQKMALKQAGTLQGYDLYQMAKSIIENPSLIGQVSGANLVRVNRAIREMQGSAPLSGTQAKEQAKVKGAMASAEAVVGGLKNLLSKVDLAKSPIERITLGIGNKLEAWAQTDPNATAYEQARKALAGNIRNALGGEVGVMTDRDLDRVVPFIPSLTDTQDVADLKFEQMVDQIEQIIREKMSAQSVGAIGQQGGVSIPAPQKPTKTKNADPLGLR